MATGAFFSCTIKADGETATLLFDEPAGGGSWDELTVSEDTGDWPYFEVNVSTQITVDSIEDPLVDSDGRLFITLNLSGIIYAGQSVLIKTQAEAGPLVTDDGGDATEVFESESVTNSSMVMRPASGGVGAARNVRSVRPVR